MNKGIYRCYYVVGWSRFHSCDKMIVDKETDKMYYGVVLNARFAVHKRDLNSVCEIVDRKYGTVYRIQVDDVENEHEAKQKARQIIYDYVIDFVERFKNNKDD